MVLCNMCKGVVIPPPPPNNTIEYIMWGRNEWLWFQYICSHGDRLDGCHWNKDLTKVQAWVIHLSEERDFLLQWHQSQSPKTRWSLSRGGQSVWLEQSEREKGRRPSDKKWGDRWCRALVAIMWVLFLLWLRWEATGEFWVEKGHELLPVCLF